MNENDIVKAIGKVIDDLRKEYTEYHGQYKLLTHFGNLNTEDDQTKKPKKTKTIFKEAIL